MQPVPRAKQAHEASDQQNHAEMQPLSTFLVRPFRHQMPNSPDSYIQVTEKGLVCLYLAKQQKKIQISPDGLRVFIESSQK